jgi:iron complex transport system ATP-binding protein
VQDVSLALGGDECVSLVGPNGSGKTTLLLALLGLLPAGGGTIRLNGRDLRDIPPRERGRFAAYVPQVLERTPAFRVYDVVAGGRFPHVGPLGPLSAADRAVIQKALDCCGLAELTERPFNAISGGERQKTLIAAAIAQDPQVMFLDEPNTALDPAYQRELVGILRDWHAHGRGLLLISHDLQLPAALRGRVIAMKQGHIAADGPATEVLAPEVLNGIYGAEFTVVTGADGQRFILTG